MEWSTFENSPAGRVVPALGGHRAFVPHPLPPPVELTLFRTAQEGLTNIRKHAQATQVTVALDYAETAVQLTIQDNGVGAAELDESGFGLVGLRERVALLGGQVQITTGAGQGFTL